MDGFDPGSEWSVLNHDTLILNLTEANRLPRDQNPQWEHLYSAKSAYNLTDLTPSSWAALVESWSSEHSANFQTYYYHYYKGNPPTKTCDAACKHKLLCDIKSAKSGDSDELCASLYT